MSVSALRKRCIQYAIGAVLALSALAPAAVPVAHAATGGNVWLTGHDADFHCQGSGPQCHYFRVAVDFVRNGSTLPILVLDHGGEVQSSINGVFSPGPIPTVTRVDPRVGFATTALLDGSGNPLYSAMIVASDWTCGGCDNNLAVTGPTAPDSAAINARSADIAAAFNKGMGVLALAGAENRSIFYNFVPIPATAVAVSPPFRFTAAGLAAGLVEGTDDNCCPTHNSFQLPPAGSALQVFETDSTGLAETLAARGAVIGGGGFGSGGCTASASDIATPAVAFSRVTVGGVPSVQVDVTDAAPSSGLDDVEASGTNLRIVSSGTNATSQTAVSPAQVLGSTSATVTGITPGASPTFTFIASKIDASASATVVVMARDCSGHVFDPPFTLHGKGLHLKGPGRSDRVHIEVTLDKD